MDSVNLFAIEARMFREWTQSSSEQAEWAVRGLLIRITRLYLAALELPPPWSDKLADQPDVVRVSDDECRAIAFSCAKRLPFDLYGEVFNSSQLPLEQPVVGSLLDDLNDIYRDVVTGLEEYESGRSAQALWEWGFGFRHHWGEHATGAIRALHSWLSENAFDRLASER